MKNIILGSGVIGSIAKSIYGDKCDIIPCGKSRFYQQDVFDDNTISVDAKQYLPDILPKYSYRLKRSSISIKGKLVFSFDEILKNMVSSKLFGNDRHPAFQSLFKECETVTLIDIKEIYRLQAEKNKTAIFDGLHKYGHIIEINLENKEIITTTGTHRYDNLISTIPLSALYRYTKQQRYFKYTDLWVYQISCNKIDIEDSDVVYVADHEYDIAIVRPVTSHNGSRYNFYCLNEIVDKQRYFGAFFKSFFIFNETRIPEAYPSCCPPNLSELENNGIYCVGKHAQCDYFMDFASSAKRLRLLEEKL